MQKMHSLPLSHMPYQQQPPPQHHPQQLTHASPNLPHTAPSNVLPHTPTLPYSTPLPPSHMTPHMPPTNMPSNLVSAAPPQYPTSSLLRGYDDVVNSLYDHLFTDILIDQCLSVHRRSKCIHWRNDRQLREATFGEDNETDIYGRSFRTLEASISIPCDNCKRTIGATKFAPHYERCMGKGRTKK